MNSARLAAAWRRWPLYGALFAIFPLVSIASQNAGQVPLPWLAVAVAAALAACAVLATVFRLVLRDGARAGLAVAVAVLAFYAYGPLGAAVDAHWLALSDGGDLTGAPAFGHRAPVLLSLGMLGVLTAAVGAIAFLDPARIRRFTAPLNAAALVAVALPVAHGLLQASQPDPGAARSSQAHAAPAAGAERPDIYYIVLDGYARRDVLGTHYGFDNSGFLGELERLGFSIVDDGNANYYWTFLSLVSALNMDYAQNLLPEMPRNSRNPSRAYELIRRNEVARFLGQLGYRYVQLQSSWGATLANPDADAFVPCGSSWFTNEYLRAIAEATWLRAWSARASADLANCHLTNMQSLTRLATQRGPKFVFAHFILPHHPYLFDRHGAILADATIANQFDFQAKLWEDRDAYLEQLRFVNDRMASILADLLARSATPPVVLVHSDHGPQLVSDLSIAEQHAVRLANFAAYHVPGGDGLIPDGDTPVNYFRRILNHTFDAGLPILANRTFYSRFYTPYQFEEVRPAAPTGRKAESR